MVVMPAMLFASPVAAQKRVDMEVKDAALEEVLKELRALSGYYILYDVADVRKVKGVSLSVKDAEAEEVLALCLAGTPLTWSMESGTIVIAPKKEVAKPEQQRKERVVKGVVRDEKGEPMPGVVVFLKSNPNAGVITDVTGRFSIRVEEGKAESLVVRFVGMKPVVTPVTEQEEYVISMEENVEEIGEVVVNGYQTISKERATGSFNILNTKAVEERHATNLSQVLDGLVAGLQGSDDGRGGKYYQIRGVSTMQANANPLIVVDGFPISDVDHLGSNNLSAFEKINPNDVESITVLKDAAAASIWGARSANGVIVITTKKGKKGEAMQISANVQTSVAQRYKLGQILTRANSADHVAYERMAFENGWMDGELTGSFDDLACPVTLAGEVLYDGLRFGRIDESTMNERLAQLANLDNRKQIHDLLLERAMTTQANVSLTAGGERSRTYVSLMYQNEREGLVGNHTNRYMMTFNNEYDLGKRVALDLGATWQCWRNDKNGLGLGDIGELSPYEMILNEDGSYAEQVKQYNRSIVATLPLDKLPYHDMSYNVLREARNRDYTTENIALRAQAGLRIRLCEGLTAEGKFQYERSSYETENYSNEETFFVRELVNKYTEYMDDEVGQSYVPKGGILQSSKGKQENYMLRGGLNFDRLFREKHAVAAILGTEYSNMYMKGRTNPYVFGYDPKHQTSQKLAAMKAPTLTSQGWEENIPGTGTTMTWRNDRFVSFYANASYTYDDRYSLSVSARSDASNLIAEKAKYRWSPFWSVGGAWSMHREKFLQEKDWVNRLVVRLTYGQNGNASNSSTYKTTLSMNSSSSSEETGTYPASITDYGNPTLRWEKTNTTNVGVDFAFWNQRLFGTVDFYNKAGRDILGTVEIASAHGTSTAVFNNAELLNRGVELTLGTSLAIPSIGMDIQSVVTYSYNHNKVTRLNMKPTDVSSLLYASYVEGKPMSPVYAYRWQGMKDGMPVIADGQGGEVGMDDWGLPNSTNWDALSYEGSAQSPHTLGWSNNFRVHDFNLSVLFLGKFGGKFRNPTFNYPVVSPYSKTTVNRFVADVLAGDAGVPGLPQPDDYGYGAWGSYYPYLDSQVECSSYIYCKEVTLGYDLPDKYLKKVALVGVGAFVKLDNVGMVWTKNSRHYHPEFLPGMAAPTLTWAFGVNVKF